MSELLIAIPTLKEAQLLQSLLQKWEEVKPFLWRKEAYWVGICGVGAAATALSLSHWLSQFPIKKLLMLGIAGTYRKELPIAQPLQVIQDAFADLGTQYYNTWIPLQKMGLSLLPQWDTPLWLTPKQTWEVVKEKVRGVTFQSTSGDFETAQKRFQQWNADIETMENASAFLVANFFNIPVATIRFISNQVGESDKNRWYLHACQQAIRNFIEKLLRQ